VGGRLLVTEAVARNLHKLMAYKDEYEVARLSIDPAVRAGAGAVRRRKLVLLSSASAGAAGARHEAEDLLGGWFRPGFRMLYAARRVRGTERTCSATPACAGSSAS